ncbi:MAG: hypothetical protein IKK29_05690 [Christensenellaceae bacterium]|nr:hypothetical protein [Christensenellaceae bacterium]
MSYKKRRAVAKERDSIVGLFCMLDYLVSTNDQNEDTVRRSKYGLRDYRLIMTKLQKLCKDVFMTIPVEQMYQIKRQMQLSYLKMVQYNAPSREKSNRWVMEIDDIIKLITYASRGACFLCNGDKKNCELSRLMDELPVEVKDTLLVACKGGI